MWLAGKMRAHDASEQRFRRKTISLSVFCWTLAFPKFPSISIKHMAINMVSDGLYILTFTPMTLGGNPAGR